MSRRAALFCVAADVAFAATIVSLLALIVAALVRPDLDLLRDAFSYYAIGPWAAVQTGAFAAMGIASLSLSLTMFMARSRSTFYHHTKGIILSASEESRRHLDDTGFVRRGWQFLSALFLAMSGIACFVLIWFPMGVPSLTTFVGDIHQTAGTIGGIAQLAAALSFSVAAYGDVRCQRLFALAVFAFAVSLLGAIFTQIAIWRPDFGLPMGATMRLVVLPLLLLWSAVAWRLREVCAGPA